MDWAPPDALHLADMTSALGRSPGVCGKSDRVSSRGTLYGERSNGLLTLVWKVNPDDLVRPTRRQPPPVEIPCSAAQQAPSNQLDQSSGNLSRVVAVELLRGELTSD